MGFDWFFTWWNAIYAVPLAFVLVFLAVTSLVSLAGAGFGELTQGHDAQADADHDVEVEHDLDVDHDVDVDHDLDVEHDLGVNPNVQVGYDADLNHDGHVDTVEKAIAVGQGRATTHNPVVGTLVFLGAGRAPVIMLLQILLLLWGMIGVLLHQGFKVTGPGALLWSIPVTLAASVMGTRSFALLAGRFFRQFETSVVRQNALVGRTGRVVFPVTAEEGTVHVRDEHGTLHRVRARCTEARLDAGQEIIILGYDPRGKTYQVDDSTVFVDRP